MQHLSEYFQDRLPAYLGMLLSGFVFQIFLTGFDRGIMTYMLTVLGSTLLSAALWEGVRWLLRKHLNGKA